MQTELILSSDKLADISASHADDPLRLAKEFLLSHYYNERGEQTLYYHRGKWLRFNGLAYEEADSAMLDSEITFFVAHKFKELSVTDGGNKKPQKMSTRLTSQVFKFLTDLCILPTTREFFSWLDDPSGNADRNYITFNNGILNVPAYLRGEATAFQDPSAKWFSVVNLSFPFDPLALCPQWLAFVDQVLGHKDTSFTKLIQEMFGYCLIPDTSHEKFFLLYGTGRNGKSTIVDVLTALLNENNVSHVSLESFVKEFSLVATENKLVNVMAEITKVPLLAEGIFKEFVSGQPVATRNLFSKTFSMRPTARCICTANALPSIKDHSDGFWRRLILIPFEFQISEENKDTALAPKLKKELSGIALWALQGLERLRLNGAFTIPTACATSLTEYKENGNPVGTFLKENFEPCEGNEITLKDIIALFTATAIDEDSTIDKPSQAELSREIQTLWPSARCARKLDIMSNVKMRFVRGLKQRES